MTTAQAVQEVMSIMLCRASGGLEGSLELDFVAAPFKDELLAGMAEMADDGVAWDNDTLTDFVEIEHPPSLLGHAGFVRAKDALDNIWDAWLAWPTKVSPAQSAGDAVTPSAD